MMYLDISDAQAWALAQFFKRLGHDTIRAHAQNNSEADEISEAISKAQSELKNAGYNPR